MPSAGWVYGALCTCPSSTIATALHPKPLLLQPGLEEPPLTWPSWAAAAVSFWYSDDPEDLRLRLTIHWADCESRPELDDLIWVPCTPPVDQVGVTSDGASR